MTKPKRIPLPLTRFDRKRHWLDLAGEAGPEASTEAAGGAVGAKAPGAENGEGAAAVFSGDEAYLRDHTVAGEAVVLGVTFAGLALAEARRRFGAEAPVKARRLVFAQMLALRAGETKRVWLREEAAAAVASPALASPASAAAASSAGGETEWIWRGGADEATAVECARARVGVAPEERRPARLDLAGWREGAGAARDTREGEALYAAEAAGAIHHGPTLRTVRKLWRRPGAVLVELEMATGAREFGGLEPALLDGAITALGALEFSVGGAFVPFLLKELVLWRAPGRRAWAEVRLAKESAELIEADILLADEAGEVCARVGGFTCKRIGAAAAAGTTVSSGAGAGTTGGATIAAADAEADADAALVGAEALERGMEGFLRELLAPLAGRGADAIPAEANFMELGVDSNQLVSLVRAIEGALETELYPTLFFEHPNLAALTTHLCQEHAEACARLVKTSPAARVVEAPVAVAETDAAAVSVAATAERATAPAAAASSEERADAPTGGVGRNGAEADDIAIIGCAGVFAGSPDLDAFWRNLRAGADLIREIPADHFDYKPWYDPTPGAPDKLYCTAGSFIDDVDKFDAAFFNVTPVEAEVMDPQMRHLLQVLVHTAEDAGKGRSIRGSNTGMYVGVCFHDYQNELYRDGKPIEPHDGSGNAPTMLANRPSFFFDLRGPSLALDTACSSSLVALHLACKALQRGECEMAFAAGVNFLLGSAHYRAFCSIGALSPTGRCHTFDARADGYVPGEGVGAVLLKPLRRALADGDRVHAVVKGSAVNHGGYTPSVTAPSTKQEAAVIQAAWRDAGVAPETIGYIEAHGTGTRLGDPVEINALKLAFKDSPAAVGSCRVGSAKAHIGHAEGAAGVVGVLKVILAMKAGEIPAMPGFGALNPYIQIDGSPLRINREVEKWIRPAGAPRRAGVSSFGFGGAYAHVVIEEAPEAAPGRTAAANGAGGGLAGGFEGVADGARLVVLSARDEDRLLESARRLEVFLGRENVLNDAAPTLEDIAWTLQTGRAGFEARVAFAADNLDGLRRALSRFVAGEADARRWSGLAKPSREKPLAPGGLGGEELARRWVSGAEIDWAGLYPAGARRPRVVSLPGYAFARTRYWIPEPEVKSASSSASNREPEPAVTTIAARPTTPGADRAGGAGGAGVFVLRADEFYLRDHVVGGRRVLPGAVALELLGRAAGGAGLRDLVWLSPLVLGPGEERRVTVSASADGADAVELRGEGADGGVTHARARLIANGQKSEALGTEDLAALRARCTETWSGARCYERFAALGFAYGPGMRSIVELRKGSGEALATLVLPGELADGAAAWAPHPALLDGALQTLMVAGAEATGGAVGAMLPFAVAEARWVGRLPARCLAHVKAGRAAAGLRYFDVAILDETGRRLLVLRDLAVRAAAGERPAEAARGPRASADGETVVFGVEWVARPLAPSAASDEACLVFGRPGSEAVWRERLGARVILVTEARAFAERADGGFELRPDAAEDHVRLVAALARRAERPTRIVHAWAGKGFVPNPTATAVQWEKGARSVFRLCRAWQGAESMPAARLLFVYPEGGGEAGTLAGDGQHYRRTPFVYQESGDGAPQHATARGLALALRREAARVRCATLAAGDEAAVDWRGELESLREADAAEAVRVTAGGRWVRRWREAPVAGASRLAGGTGASVASSGGGRGAAVLSAGDVAIVSGGLGGLGRGLAARLAARGLRVLVTGRTPESDARVGARLAEIAAAGGEVAYVAGDCGRADDVARIYGAARSRWGRVDAIFHLAGGRRDARLVEKTEADWTDALGGKALGALHWDAVSRGDAPKAFVLFGSVAGALGNAGQTDYAAANAFLEDFALWRASRRPGRTLAVAWPLWAEGGMTMAEDARRRLREETGLAALPSEAGWAVLDALLAGEAGVALVLFGEAERLRALVSGAGATEKRVAAPGAAVSAGAAEARPAVREDLRRRMARATKLPLEQIKPERNFDAYGIDSVLIVKLTRELEADFGPLPTTLFFEYPNLEELAGYFCTRHAAKVAERFGAPAAVSAEASTAAPVAVEPAARPLTATGAAAEVLRGPARAEERRSSVGAVGGAGAEADDAVAIIGLAGRYPQARSLEEFWANLRAGRDSITEVPKARWDHARIFNPDKETPGAVYGKWGGFIEDFDHFDPTFFGISPREAGYMDPQERLFLETAWATLEDAGYTRARAGAASVGVFVGVMWAQYQMYAPESVPLTGVAPGSSFASIANRVSYALNLRGPSLALDTMCSSSLTALHLACQSLRAGDCELALAGGVNLTVHPNKYFQLSQGRFLSTDGRCRSFGEGGDGYVPGEGVGAVLLKPLGRALADGDPIRAVIRGSMLNHGGRTNGYTVPSPVAQAELIARAVARAGIDPRTLGYIEAHGTGTSLGDPIEINGLNRAFAAAGLAPGSCAIGSVKSNIGHLESAAGIAGLTKVLLQFEHGEIAPSLHAETLNPGLALAESPFVVQREPAVWPRPAGGAEPRRAGLSSFGAGGANAHVILEEWAGDGRTATRRDGVRDGMADAAGEGAAPRLLVLSAKSEASLSAQARRLAEWLAAHPGAALADVAWTLQIGREAMERRLALVASTGAEARELLLAHVAGRADPGWVAGDAREPGAAAALLEGEAGRAFCELLMQQGDLAKLARLWVAGAEIDWACLPGMAGARRIALPTYAFERKRYWFDHHAGVSAGTRATAPVAVAAERMTEPAATPVAKPVVAPEPVAAVASVTVAAPVSVPMSEPARAAASGMDAVATRKAIREILAGVLYLEPETVAENRAMMELGVDSILGVELVKKLNARFSLQLKATTLYDHPTVIALAEAVAEALAVAPAGASGPAPAPALAPISAPVATPEPAPVAAAAAAPTAARPPAQVAAGLDVAATRRVIREILAGVLYLEPDAVAENRAMMELGVDSILGVELVKKLNARFGLQLKATALYDHPTVAALAELVAGAVAAPASVTVPGREPAPAPSSGPVAPPPEIGRATAVSSAPAVPALKLKIATPPAAAVTTNGKLQLKPLALAKAPTVSAPLGQTPPAPVLVPTPAPVAVTQVAVTPQAAAPTAVAVDRPPAAVAPERVSDDAAAARAVAVIGMAGKFPGADTLDEFWRNLRDGVNSVGEVPPSRWDVAKHFDPDPAAPGKSYSKWGGFLRDIELFDPLFFGITPAEAECMDPQQRLFMQETWRALEDAGLAAEAVAKRKCGLFVGVMDNDYLDLMDGTKPSHAMLGNSNSILAARMAYFLNLRGPAVTMDTACSSSLVAIHLACRSLLDGETDLMIAGGVCLYIGEKSYIGMSKGGMLARDGRCKTFDDRADGFVPGEGVGVVILKRLDRALADGDPIRGVIRASGINQDGKTNGITAPSAQSQRDLEIEVYAKAGINPETISYVEAHGTGTKLGDPVEISGLTEAFRRSTTRRGFCPIGSLKTNTGHTSAAAGVLGLIKVLLAMEHRQIPPSLHFETENEHLGLADTPFVVNTRLTEWRAAPGAPRRAALSSFGFSGTNAHAVIDEPHAAARPREQDAPATQTHAVIDEPPAARAEEWQLVPLSGQTTEALRARVSELHAWLGRAAEAGAEGGAVAGVALADVALTLQIGRSHFRHRAAFLARSVAELRLRLAEALAAPTRTREQALENVFGGIEAGGAVGAGGARDAEATRVAELSRLAAAYVAREDGLFTGLAGNGSGSVARRIGGLPTYPFARERYWVPAPARRDVPAVAPAAVDDGRELEAPSTLLELSRAEADHADGHGWRTVLRPEFFFIADHRVGGRRMCPGVVHLELARAAHARSFATTTAAGGVALRDVVWTRPLLVEDAVALCVGLRGTATEARFETWSEEGGRRVVHARGKILAGVGAGGREPADAASSPSLPAEAANWPRVRTGEEIYRLLEARGLAYGPTMRGVERLFAREGEVVARLELPATVARGEAAAWHPTLLDAALQTIIGLAEDEAAAAGESEARTFVPVALGAVDARTELPARLVAHLRAEPSTDAARRSHAVSLRDEAGREVMALRGYVLEALKTTPAASASAAPAPAAAELPPAASTAPATALRAPTLAMLTDLFVAETKLPRERIDVTESFDRYGVDSMIAESLAADLEKIFGKLPKTLLFEHHSLAKLADYLLATRGEVLARRFAPAAPVSPSAPIAPAPSATPVASATSAAKRVESVPTVSAAPAAPARQAVADGGIAIVGLSGRYPLAPTLEAFWANLAAGRDCITEVPPERWDNRRFFDPDPRRPLKSYMKWGGFLDGVDRFDPFFFNVSPREARFMDPQERLFLETAWQAVEDAGYARAELAGAKVGVFVGAMWSHYQLFGADAAARGEGIAPGGSFASIANRVSFFFDWHGPSLALDTMCSSSLTAIHLACESIRRGECAAALAGGVNLTLHPNKYLLLSQGKFASTDGRCRSFGAGGDGYVPGEGVGAVLLKPLARALADGDHIHGVIRGSALNHGGRTNGYTVPDPAAQGEVIGAALAAAGVPAESIGYVEAHGTGTGLGDPIEIAGLAKVFARGAGGARCAIGSVKSNIGHLESAAGIAGLTKILLQFRHGKLAPSLHAEPANPRIDFSDTPFVVQRGLAPWAATAGGPRRAGLSSFGAGGGNAHLVVEEHVPARTDAAGEDADGSDAAAGARGPELIVLSARRAEQVREMAGRLAERLEGAPEAALRDVAWTLRRGREVFDRRAAAVAGSMAELRAKLAALAAGETAGWVLGDAKDAASAAALMDEEDARALLARWTRDGRMEKLAGYWARGGKVVWAEVLPDRGGRRTSLPTYPFARERHWIDVPPRFAAGRLHPLLDRVAVERSLGEGLVLEKAELPAVDPWRGVGEGAGGLSAGAVLEAMRAAAAMAGPGEGVELRDWELLGTGEAPREESRLQVRLRGEGEARRVELWETGSGRAELRARAGWSLGAAEPDAGVGAATGAAAAEGEAGRERGGPGDGAVGAVGWSLVEREADELRARFVFVCAEDEAPAWGLYPECWDGAARLAAGLLGGGLAVASVARVLFRRPVPAVSALRVRRVGPDTVEMLFTDAAGRVCVEAGGVRLAAPADALGRFFCVPRWRERPLNAVEVERGLRARGSRGRVVLVVRGPEAAPFWDALVATHGDDACEELVLGAEPADWRALVARLPRIDTCYFGGALGGPNPRERTPEALAEAQGRGLFALFGLVRALLAAGYAERALELKVLTPGVHEVVGGEVLQPFAASLGGLAKAVAKEQPKWSVAALDLYGWHKDPLAAGGEDPVALAAAIRAEPRQTRGEDVALRGGRRHVRRLVPAELPAAGAASGLRTGGCYLIVGGLGSVGFETARHLARRHRARLVLMGRSPLDDAKRARIRELETLGAEVLHVAADASGEAGLREALARGRERFGPLHGVFHSAMVYYEARIEEQDERAFRAAVAAKLESLVWLHALLKDAPPDFLMVYSSAQSFTANAGRGHYSAGCLAEDAWAAAIRDTVAYPVKVVNWGYWRVEGIDTAEHRDALAAQGVRLIEAEEGMDAMCRVLAGPVNQALALKVDDSVLELMGADLDETLVFAPGERSATLRRRAERAELPAAASVPAARREGMGGGKPAASGASPAGPAREKTASDATARVAEATRESVARVLGTTAGALDEGTPFLEFGVDSVLAVEIIRAINMRLSIELRPTDLFNYATLAKLNRHILTAHAERLATAVAADAAVAEPVAEAAVGAKAARENDDNDSDRTDDDALMLRLLEQLESGKLSADQVARTWEEKRARAE